MGLPLLVYVLYYVLSRVNRAFPFLNRLISSLVALMAFIVVPLLMNPPSGNYFPVMAVEAVKYALWDLLASFWILKAGARHFWISLALSAGLGTVVCVCLRIFSGPLNLARYEALAAVFSATLVFVCVPFLVGLRGPAGVQKPGSRTET